MREEDNSMDFEATVRRAFGRLTREDLPRAAVSRNWPVRTPEEFQRLLLDHLRERPPGEPNRPGSPCLVDLILAVELGERLLAGNLCCTTMNRRARCEAATGDPRRANALKALQEILAKPGPVNRTN